MDTTAFRHQFPVTRRWAYLDHAAVGPIPVPAVAAMEEYARRASENGVAAWPHWADQVAEVRRLAARMLNVADPEDVCFVPNTTTGINLIAEGFPWQPGDNVVLPADEYPSNQYPWLNLNDRGVEVRSVPGQGNRVDVDDLRAAITDRTRVVSVSFVEFATGFRNDLDAIGAVCREKGIFFFVDAIQGLGALPLDVQRTPIDAVACGGHKWLFGPEGAGVLYIRRDWIDRLRPILTGAHSVRDSFNYGTIAFVPKPHAGRYEGGAINLGGIAGLGASLDLHLTFGPAEIARRVQELTDYLCDRATAAGWSVFSSRRPGETSGIVSLEVPGTDPKEVVRRCRAAGVIVNARGGRVRVSPHGYNTEDEIDRFIDAARA